MSIVHSLGCVKGLMNCVHVVSLLCNKKSNKSDIHIKSAILGLNSLSVIFNSCHLFAYFISLTLSSLLCFLSLSLIFSPHCGLLLSYLGLFFKSSLQDVFKEARSHDHVEAKNDMETHIRSRKLPLTRKIYAFYHAPIVKFWSNTVGRLQEENTHTHAYRTVI